MPTRPMRFPSAPYRAITLPRRAVWRATLFSVLSGAVTFFVFEASKSAIFPNLTIWESHWITIVFGSCIAGGAAWFSMRRQAQLLRTIAAEEGRRTILEVQQRALEESEQRFRRLVEQSPQAIAVHRNGTLLYVNRAGVHLMGETEASALIGQSALAFVHPADRATVQQRSWGDGSTARYRVRRTDGVEREVESVSVLVEYEGDQAVQTVFRDITDQRALEARLLHEAFHDSLTGLANRALFRDRVEHALSVSLRGAPSQMAVLFLDLDDFKGVNDSLGHDAGDRLLVDIAERLKLETRDGDTVARFGGDEFAVLLEQLHSEQEALAVVNRLKVALRRPLLIDGRLLSVSASIGVAVARAGDDVDTLLRNADVAMYEAKEQGKARHALFEPAMYEAIVHRLQLESDLRTAASAPEASGLSVVYQPIVDLHTGELRSLEALLRWQHPMRGAVTPGTFIPVAERTGVIVPIGRYVLESVCRQLVQWQQTSGVDATEWRSMSVSVNISGRQLAEEQFVSELELILQRTGAPPESLTLEITESVIMRDTEATLRTLSAIRRLGVRLAIDDFGTGYSSLSYLQRFPVDVLKIDRAFVEGVSRNGSDAALARTIITLGQTLSLRTVAEGIEDEAQRRTLALMGCHLGQGYLFAPPLPAAAVRSWRYSADRAILPRAS